MSIVDEYSKQTEKRNVDRQYDRECTWICNLYVVAKCIFLWYIGEVLYFVKKGVAVNKNAKIIFWAAAGVLLLTFVLVMTFSLQSAPADIATGDEAYTEETQAATTSPEDSGPLILSFIGDCILGSESGKSSEGNFTHTAETRDHSYFFEKVYDVLSKDDLTFANCEVVLSDRNLEKTYKDYSPAFWFIAPAKNADILKLGSVEVAGVVNNHVNDYGDEGYSDTVKALQAQGLYVGENLTPLYFEEKGIKIGVLYCNLWAPYNLQYIEPVLEEMQDNCDYKIIFFHGGTEAVHEPDNYKIDACRYLAQSGLCDLIIGSHPHVLQPMEVVNGVPIVYSLGNFCYSANNYPENRTIIFQAELFEEDGEIRTQASMIPCYVYTGYKNNWQPALVEDEDVREEIVAMMTQKVEHQTEPESTAEPTTVPETQQEVYSTSAEPDPTESSLNMWETYPAEY